MILGRGAFVAQKSNHLKLQLELELIVIYSNIQQFRLYHDMKLIRIIFPHIRIKQSFEDDIKATLFCIVDYLQLSIIFRKQEKTKLIWY